MRVVWFNLLLLCLFSSCFANEQDLLKTQDISRIMQQILQHHLEKKVISNDLFKHSLIIFIQQFDPYKMYLLEKEVQPYRDLSDAQVNELISEYKNGNFKIFKEINDLIQKSIIRSRELRPALENKAKDELFQLSVKKEYTPELTANKDYATNIEELKNRMYSHLDLYIIAQRHHYGDSVIARRKDQTIRSYENNLDQIENQYLYVDEKNHPLPEPEQENLFTLHVLKALASSLDSHTSFYKPREAFDIRIKLQKEFQGFGIFLKESNEGIYVSRLLPGGPAEKSGLISPGDILIEVQGKPILDLSFDEVMQMLHDEKVPEETLVIKRKEPGSETEKLFTVKLKRQEIIIDSDRVGVNSVAFGNGIIGILTLNSFYEGNGLSSEMDLRNAINQLEKTGKLKGLILDLRNNSGGFLSQAIKVAGLFITSGVIVVSKYDNNDEKIYRDVDSKVAYDGPFVVLISKLTASAAEIVAQALQDYGVAVIVGDDHSFGKGTIQSQTVTDNQSSSYFKVTIGKYYTVSGKTPQKYGVKSDIIVPGPLNDKKIGEEYLDSVAADHISPLYNDQLEDVPNNDKNWYLKYYTPKIQHSVLTWHKMLPSLIKNSEYRIANNKDYQFFLKGISPKDEEESSDDDALDLEESEWIKLDKKHQNFGQNDLQLEEAENIVKDMFFLEQTKGQLLK